MCRSFSNISGATPNVGLMVAQAQISTNIRSLGYYLEHLSKVAHNDTVGDHVGEGTKVLAYEHWVEFTDNFDKK